MGTVQSETNVLGAEYYGQVQSCGNVELQTLGCGRAVEMVIACNFVCGMPYSVALLLVFEVFSVGKRAPAGGESAFDKAEQLESWKVFIVRDQVVDIHHGRRADMLLSRQYHFVAKYSCKR